MRESLAQVVELVDTPDLGSGAARCVGSSPILGKPSFLERILRMRPKSIFFLLVKRSVVTLIFNRAKTEIVLLKRRDVPIWVLPGGGIEEGELSSEAALRESCEETGLTVAIARHVATYRAINRLAHDTDLYECTPVSGNLSIGAETRELAFFPIQALPQPFFFIHNDWLQDALKNEPFVINKALTQVSYSRLLRYLLRHPLQVARFTLSLLGCPINHRD